MNRFPALSRIEASPYALTAAKVINAGLTLAWGFAVTYVFVRALPITDFRAFLILIAFANFVIGAEFGLTTMLYSRMRRHWLSDDAARSDSYAEMPYLFSRLALLIGFAVICVSFAVGFGAITTEYQLLFLLFFTLSCLNILVILLKRALSAIDRNALWELVDIARRALSLGLLLTILAGVDATTIVAAQLAIALAALAVGMAVAGRQLGIDARAWWGHVALTENGRRNFWRAGRKSALLTVSEVAIYNAPYLTIGLVSGDPKPVLIYDFSYKFVRAFYTILRAFAEGIMPRLTSAFYRGDSPYVRRSYQRLLYVGLVGSAGIAALLVFFGEAIFAKLYDHATVVSAFQLAMIALLLVTFVPVAFSILFQGPLGRFSNLLSLSLPLLAITLLCAPIAALLDRFSKLDFTSVFITVYALGFGISAWVHTRSIYRLLGSVEPVGKR